MTTARRLALLLTLLAALVSCGDETSPASSSADPTAECERFEEVFAEPATDEGSTVDQVTEELVVIFGDEVPADIADAVTTAIDDAATREARGAAVVEALTWLRVECGGPAAGDVRLAPVAVPEGMVLCVANDVLPLDPPDDAGAIVIWGDAALADPWGGPLAGLFSISTEEIPVHDGAAEIVVRGVDGYVAPMSLFQGVSSVEWGHIVTWRDPGGRVIEVAVRAANPAGAVALAERVTVADGVPSLPVDALGAQTEPIADETPIAPFVQGAVSVDSWSLSYQPIPITGGDSRLLSITGFSLGAEAMLPLRFWAVTSETIRLRGVDGLAYVPFPAETDSFGVAWEEAPGVVVQVVGLGLGLDRQAVLDIAAGLETVDADGWRAVKQQAIDADCF